MDALDAQIAFRLPADLAEAFAQVAASEDRSASAELRRLMREHVAQHDDGRPHRRPIVEAPTTPEPTRGS